jgi:hypothetical protein
MAKRLLRPPSGSAADLPDHAQHHFQCGDRIRARWRRLRCRRAARRTAEIEQVSIDFKVIDEFNWRAPGIDLVPIGYINEHHEPTAFYSVNRPPLYKGLIAPTWKVPATGVSG